MEVLLCGGGDAGEGQDLRGRGSGSGRGTVRAVRGRGACGRMRYSSACIKQHELSFFLLALAVFPGKVGQRCQVHACERQPSL